MTRREQQHAERATRNVYVFVVFAALSLSFVVVLLPLTHHSDFVSDVISMAILIGTLTFARALDRRSGVIVALLAGAVAAFVPGVPSFPPSSAWEAVLRLSAFATMTLVYYRVIATLRAREERVQRQISDLRTLHHEVRALHVEATTTAGTRDAVYAQIVRGAAHLVEAPRARLIRRGPDGGAWAVIAQLPRGAWPGAPAAVAPVIGGDTGAPSLTPDAAGGMRITVPILMMDAELFALEVNALCADHDYEEYAQLLAVYARDVQLVLEHISLQERLAQLVRIEERGRIARELHDGLVQSLGGIAYRIEYYSEALREQNVDAIRAELTASATIVRSALRDARLMIYGLRDGEQPGDLRARLLSLLDTVVGETAVEIVTDLPPVLPMLPATKADAVVRIAQEALQNAVKHADAESVSLVFLVEPGRVEMTVADDGCGFVYCPHDGTERPLRYGLIGMEERAAQSGGRLTIQTQPEMGTCVTLILPVPEAAA